ncbi:MAG: hypothetical protein HY986_13995 [Candidatus Melainabacteria bacterium]|nr:hypothetical protein [Candidatus Melainabacteria bacterium]
MRTLQATGGRIEIDDSEPSYCQCFLITSGSDKYLLGWQPLYYLKEKLMRALREEPTDPKKLLFAGAFEPHRYALYLARQGDKRHVFVQDDELPATGDKILHTLELSQEDVDSWILTLHR